MAQPGEQVVARLLACHLVAAAIAVPGCLDDNVPGCPAEAQPSGNAPLLAPVNDPAGLMAEILALAGDAPVNTSLSEDDGIKVARATTRQGGQATLSTREGHLWGFHYLRDGHAVAYGLADVQGLLASFAQAIGVGLDPGAVAAEHFTLHHGEEVLSASHRWLLDGLPVQVHVPGDGPFGGVANAQDMELGAQVETAPGGLRGRSFGFGLPDNSTFLHASPLAALPDPATFLEIHHALRTARAVVACRLDGSWLEGDIGGAYRAERAFVVAAGSVGIPVAVDFGDACPAESFTSGRQWEVVMAIDAVTGAVLAQDQAGWNCIGVPEPSAALRPPTR